LAAKTSFKQNRKPLFKTVVWYDLSVLLRCKVKVQSIRQPTNGKMHFVEYIFDASASTVQAKGDFINYINSSW
jgi:carbon monoxide dehydrogenase subunit G